MVVFFAFSGYLLTGLGCQADYRVKARQSMIPASIAWYMFINTANS